jgi:hypothetical protein
MHQQAASTIILPATLVRLCTESISNAGSAAVETWVIPYHNPLDVRVAAPRDTRAVALDAQGNDGPPNVIYELTRADHIEGPSLLIGTFAANPDGTAEYLDLTATSAQSFYRVSTSFLTVQTSTKP